MIFDNGKVVKMTNRRFLAKIAIFLTFHHTGKSQTFGLTASNFYRIFKIPQREENIAKFVDANFYLGRLEQFKGVKKVKRPNFFWSFRVILAKSGF